ncbi:MAG: NUDIX domain-containing protein [archaeon]
MNEKIVIVNKKDEVIGYKDRELAEKDIYRVSALWIKNSKNEFLLARRAYTKSHSPGKWGPAVAGTVEKGETYKKNMIKEVKEELGLESLNLVKGPKLYHEKEHRYFVQWFLLVIDREISKFRFDKKEVAEIKWFSKKEFLNQINSNPEEFIPSIEGYSHLFQDEI